MSIEPQIIILMGPNGAGKTTLGHILEKYFESRFVSIEEFFLDRYSTLTEHRQQRPEAYLLFEECVRLIVKHTKSPVVFEEVGLSNEAQTLIKKLQDDFVVVLVKITASEPLCLKRVAERGGNTNFPKSGEFVSQVYRQFRDMPTSRYHFALEIENEHLTEIDICEKFSSLLSSKKRM